MSPLWGEALALRPGLLCMCKYIFAEIRIAFPAYEDTRLGAKAFLTGTCASVSPLSPGKPKARRVSQSCRDDSVVKGRDPGLVPSTHKVAQRQKIQCPILASCLCGHCMNVVCVPPGRCTNTPGKKWVGETAQWYTGCFSRSQRLDSQNPCQVPHNHL